MRPGRFEGFCNRSYGHIHARIQIFAYGYTYTANNLRISSFWMVNDWNQQALGRVPPLLGGPAWNSPCGRWLRCATMSLGYVVNPMPNSGMVYYWAYHWVTKCFKGTGRRSFPIAKPWPRQSLLGPFAPFSAAATRSLDWGWWEPQRGKPNPPKVIWGIFRLGTM